MMTSHKNGINKCVLGDHTFFLFNLQFKLALFAKLDAPG